MEFMGATLRKITLRDGLSAAGLAGGVSAGMAVAFHMSGRDPWQALDAAMPIFIGALATSAGVNPVRSPMLMGLIAAGAVAVMAVSRLAMGIPLN
jgi:hypothetical protein